MGLPAKRALLKAWRARRPDIVQVVTEGPLGNSAVTAARSARDSGGLRVPHQLPRLQPALRARALQRARRAVPPPAAQPRRLHLRADRRDEVPARRGRLPAARGRRARDRPRRCSIRGAGAPRCGAVGAPASTTSSRSRSAGSRRRRTFASSSSRAARCRRCVPRLQGGRRRRRARRRGAAQRRTATSSSPGCATGAALAEHYASADMFLFPSLTETFGNVTMEAMASRLAIVAFDYACRPPVPAPPRERSARPVRRWRAVRRGGAGTRRRPAAARAGPGRRRRRLPAGSPGRASSTNSRRSSSTS